MSRAISLLVAFCVSTLMLASVATADSGPSKGAKDMAGAKGTFVFKPADWKSGTATWWKDTDGVDPGAAGCHIGTDSSGAPNGRSFGEACLENGLLVESNPGADKVHKHTDDIGHPDTFDCNAWCTAKGSKSGMCVPVTLKDSPCATSAKCECK